MTTMLVHDLPVIMMLRATGLQGLKPGQLSIHHFSLQAGSSECSGPQVQSLQSHAEPDTVCRELCMFAYFV